MASFGERVRALRRAHGWTQKRLQEVSGVPFTTISRIETGTTEVVTSQTLESLATTFGVTLDYLMGRSDAPRGAGCG